jgi:DNA (cytosine-5)-methyltransferase 1
VSRPVLLDLFCGAGGAAAGYARAGFDVVGVDLNPQPRYPFEFYRLEALDTLRDLLLGGNFPNGRALGDFAAIHASPPCKASTSLRHLWPDREHVNLIDPTRELLAEAGRPYVIENVVGASLRNPVVLCGSMFGLGAAGRQLRRHRLFECSFPLTQATLSCRHAGSPIGVYGTGSGGQHTRGFRANADESREALGAPWMTKAECSQAIPPAYTEWIGQRLLAAIETRAAA